MRKLVLDTNVLIAFLQNPENFAERFSGYDVILLPPVVLGEFRAGLFDTKVGRENRKAIDAFLQNPAVKACPMTDNTSLCYAKVFQALRKAGKPIPTNVTSGSPPPRRRTVPRLQRTTAISGRFHFCRSFKPMDHKGTCLIEF